MLSFAQYPVTQVKHARNRRGLYNYTRAGVHWGLSWKLVTTRGKEVEGCEVQCKLPVAAITKHHRFGDLKQCTFILTVLGVRSQIIFTGLKSSCGQSHPSCGETRGELVSLSFPAIIAVDLVFLG